MGDRILVLAEHEGGSLRDATFEILGLAHEVAAASGRSVGSVILGSGIDALAQDLASRGGGEVLQVDSPALGEYTQDGWGRALEALIEQEKPWMVLAVHSPTGWDLLPRLGAAAGVAVATEITAVAVESDAPVLTRKVFGGKFEVRVAPGASAPFLATVQKGSHEAPEGAAPGSVRAFPFELEASALRTRFVEVRQGESGGVDLTAAEVIVAGGRGVGSPEKFAIVRELAESLGAQIGASRPVTDAGWLSPEHQVGSSGVTVAPKLYIAAGISGAIQHIMGIKGAGFIVAINKDAEAPIFGAADVGIVGDLFEVIPALTAAIREAKG